MKYNEALANRIREALADYLKIEEKEMFGCLAFMVNDKLCICVQLDSLLLRIDPTQYDELLEKEGCREMKMGNRIMKGYVQVAEEVLHSKKDFDYWVSQALSYNRQAKTARKKTK